VFVPDEVLRYGLVGVVDDVLPEHHVTAVFFNLTDHRVARALIAKTNKTAIVRGTHAIRDTHTSRHQEQAKAEKIAKVAKEEAQEEAEEEEAEQEEEQEEDEAEDERTLKAAEALLSPPAHRIGPVASAVPSYRPLLWNCGPRRTARPGTHGP
jgi:hypothetical protein